MIQEIIYMLPQNKKLKKQKKMYEAAPPTPPAPPAPTPDGIADSAMRRIDNNWKNLTTEQKQNVKTFISSLA